MSAIAEPPTPKTTDGNNDADRSDGTTIKLPDDNYKAFVAGIASGIAKLSGMSDLSRCRTVSTTSVIV